MNGIHLVLPPECEEPAEEVHGLVDVEGPGPQEPQQSSVAGHVGILRHPSQVTLKKLFHPTQLPLLLGTPAVVHRRNLVRPVVANRYKSPARG